MPTYQYRCKDCGHDLEAVQKFTDDPLTECPSCGGSLRKVYNAVGVVFKGSGFYRTDSRKPDQGPSEKSSGDKGAAEKSTGDKGSGQKSSAEKGSTGSGEKKSSPGSGAGSKSSSSSGGAGSSS